MPEVNNASDDPTANNAVGHQYRVLSDGEKAQMIALKDIIAAFIAKCQEIGGSRELSLAVANAEQAVMWAVKNVTRLSAFAIFSALGSLWVGPSKGQACCALRMRATQGLGQFHQLERPQSADDLWQALA